MKLIALLPFAARLSVNAVLVFLCCAAFGQPENMSALASANIASPLHARSASRTAGATLKDFKAEQKKEGICLSWMVADQIHDAFFEVQRSLSGGSYVRIGAMVSATTGNYHFVDKGVVQPAYFYRVKIISSDGAISYSNPIRVQTARKNTIRLSPNLRKAVPSKGKTIQKTKSANKAVIIYPKHFSSSVVSFSDKLIFNISLRKKNEIKVHLFTLEGRISLQREFSGNEGNNEIVIDRLALLPPGSYTVVIGCNGQTFRLLARK